MDYWLNAPIKRVKVHEDLEEFVWDHTVKAIVCDAEEVLQMFDQFIGMMPAILKELGKVVVEIGKRFRGIF